MKLLLMILLRLAYLISILFVFTKEDLYSLPEVPPFCSGFTLDKFSVSPSEIFTQPFLILAKLVVQMAYVCPRLS